ncbi:hypothetical protein FCR2A7T_07350 [Flavobacterium cauense R2A-7]|uniref:Lipoprotein n=1 Tax=Flavobacterium cauense R2A-7 TaxID=1341154 RepID=V6S2Q8_9FLAO|nr:hypothetical protein [Flavobacterium cauense]ESU20963.1 hypothetical protein FCR2A7T_07350 [Flavobacterium cauense R2A-7]KGO79619.1 hypothetical protein Q762_14055 [Flavobacterium cauense R2A-7]TWI08366.1 hypothetical protein IP98_02786 [Flavobacterium cauense R2A-7]
MKIQITFIILLFFISCKKDDTEKSIQNLENQSQNLIKSTDTSKIGKVVFEKHPAFGIIIYQNHSLFDENLNEIGQIYSKGFEKVHIVERTKMMYNLKNSSEDCEKAYFIKIKYNNQECIIFGKEVFEINTEQLFSFKNLDGEKFSLFPVTNFEMGASDENGLTGCDDYSILIIENKTRQNFASIRYPINGTNRNIQKLEKAVLIHDEGSDEIIQNVSIKNDTLVIGIKAIYQEGGSSYNLKTTFKDNFSKSIITDKINFEEEE